jgi:2-isopropylmalate synthase
MEKEFGFDLPKEMQPEFARVIQAISEKTGKDVLPTAILQAFEDEYLRPSGPFGLKVFEVAARKSGSNPRHSHADIQAVILWNGEDLSFPGTGNGPIDAFCNGLRKEAGIQFSLVSYHEHALERGSDSMAVSYIGIEDISGRPFHGVGVDTDTVIASIRAVLSALNRAALTLLPVSSG